MTEDSGRCSRRAAHESCSVTVITAARNSETTLAATIESVIQQEVPDLEYIIIDGQSTDRTLEIARSYSERFDPGWMTIVSEPDAGVYDAMNKGIGLAKGDIVALLNSDDAFVPGAIRSAIEAFGSTGADIVAGDVIARSSGNDRLLRASVAGLDTAMTVPHPGCFVRAAAYRRWGTFDTRFRIAADYELLLRMHRSGARIATLKRTTTIFGAGGMSSRAIPLAREMFAIHRRYYGAAHALRCFAIRIVLAGALNMRRKLGRVLLGDELYSRLGRVARRRTTDD